METKRRGIKKFPIEAFHENYKSSLLFILILEDGCVIPFLCISFFFLFFFFFAKIGKNGIEGKIKALKNFNS